MSGITQGLMASFNSTPAVTYATWNPSDKSANITLSNGNLTATATSSATYNSVRATIGKSSGKWYWETTVSDVTTSGWMDGIGNSSALLSPHVGTDANGWGVRFYSTTGDKAHSNSFSAYGLNSANVANSTVYGYALDMDNGTLEVFKDNVSQGVSFTGITGTIYPMISIWINGESHTTNFGATTMAYTAPAGYNQGLYDLPATNVAVLVVGGGGGSTGGGSGGGGGGGGYQYNASFSVTPQAYTVTVGAGGAGGSSGVGGSSNLGGNSSFSTLTAIGGGWGDANNVGANGGCGGGGGNVLGGGTGSQGGNGGSGSGNPYNGGGGGGAGGNGGNAISTGAKTAGAGGIGISNSISGIATYYAGGGAGGPDNFRGGTGNSGGLGGGGSSYNTGSGQSGTNGLGGGGGGSSNISPGSGGSGGSGVVIISYTTGSLSATGGTITTSGGNTIHTFTGNGTFTVAGGGDAPAIPTSGLIANWALATNSTDSVGGYNGTDSGMSYTTIGGKACASFSGSSYINIPSMSGGNSGNDYSFSTWIYTSAVPGGQVRQISLYNGASTNSSICLGTQASRGIALWGDTSPTCLSTTQVNNGAWHNIIVTRSSANGKKIYVDGVLEGSSGNGSFEIFTSIGLYFNGYDTSSAQKFIHYGRNYLCYNRELTSTEANDIYLVG